MPIDLNILNRPENRCIVMTASDTVAAAIQALLNEGGQGWWHLVVDLGEGKFAATQFIKLSALAVAEEEAFFDQTLRSLADSLIPLVQAVEFTAIGTAAARDLAYESPGSVLVVTRQGSFAGILFQGEARGVEEFSLLDRYLSMLHGTPEIGQVQSASPDRHPPRYANAALLDETEETVLEKTTGLRPGEVVRLRLDIGPLSPQSAVVDPVPVPEDLLPKDIWLDVLVSSSEFYVALPGGEGGWSGAASGRFYLPGDGSPARASDESPFLFFFLQAPMQHGPAFARINYYYHNHLVQSQLLRVEVGDGWGGHQIITDYTLTESLLDLQDLPARRQLSLLTNWNEGGHSIVARAGDEQGRQVGSPCAYRLKEESIDPLVSELRSTLRSRVAPARTRRRSKADLKTDLLALAPLGRRLWSLTAAQCLREIYLKLRTEEDWVIQVARPTTADYSFPWSLVYDIPYGEGAQWKFCELVEAWDESGPLVEAGSRSCPKAPGGRHEENTLCPFGFWGFRYQIEQLSGTDKPALEIRISDSQPLEVVAGTAQHNLNLNALELHLESLRTELKQAYPWGEFKEGKTRAEVRDLLGRDTPFVYFLCHGGREAPNDPNTFLSVGFRERISPQDFQNWVLEWLFQDRLIWEQVRPLILINACHSVEIETRTLVTYLDAFITTGHASGVIGTEVNVRPGIAMDFAQRFFELFLKGETVGQALRQIRSEYLAHGNLYGLIYTPYCWSDLRLVCSTG